MAAGSDVLKGGSGIDYYDKESADNTSDSGGTAKTWEGDSVCGD